METFADVIARVLPYGSDLLAPALTRGATVLVVAHGNSLRALVALLGHLDEPGIHDLNIPPAEPLIHTVTPDRRPASSGGRYLAPDRACAAARAVAAEGHH
ncbi:histidine phosphatase family protein [Streptomyces anthocyanicus]|uniref:histidine phosphatase family protein n=1 Tax=Streptomyces anthocyanicus TaxID=68174 RepID=UPI0036CAE518